ncbi:MAG: DNA polymerase IV, partial [Actinomycetota bacterium]|nr:DNA polymerase IV [Actinomycetota bacterium]
SARTVVVRLRFDDFTRITRSHTVEHATAETHLVLATARDLLADAAPLVEARGLTLIGVSVANLDEDAPVQLTLPFDRRDGGALDVALDAVRERFGLSALTPAVLLGRDQGIAMPVLPDARR